MIQSILARIGTLEALRRDVSRTLGMAKHPNEHAGSLACLRDLIELEFDPSRTVLH